MGEKGKNQLLVDLLIEKISKDFSDKIDFVCAYGSFARGDDDRYSDLDLIIIEADGDGGQLDLSFIVDDEIEIGYRFRSISWTQYESLIGTAHAGRILQIKQLFCRNADAREKYLRLKRLAESYLILPLDEGKLKRIEPAKYELKAINSDVQTEESYGGVKYNAIKLILKAVELLVNLNSTYFHYSLMDYEKDIAMLSILPPDFLQTYREVLESSECERTKKLAIKITRDVVQVFDKLCGAYCKVAEKPIDGAYEKVVAGVNSKYVRSQISADRKRGELVGYLLKSSVDELAKTCKFRPPVNDDDYFDKYKLPFAIKSVKEAILEQYRKKEICVKKIVSLDRGGKRNGR